MGKNLWFIWNIAGRYGPELPSRALHATPSKTFPSGFLTIADLTWLADYLDLLVTEAKKRIPHQWPVHWKVPFVWIWPGLWRWRCLRCPCWYKFVCHQIKFRSGQWGHLCLKGLFSRTTNGTLDANFKSEDHFFVILVALVCKKIRLFNNTRWLGQPQRELRDLFWKKQRQFDRNKVKSGNTSLSNMPSW